MEMTTEQLDLITSELATIKERSPFYAKKFEGIDVAAVRTQADFERLPFSEKDDLRGVYPLGLQAVPDEEVVRIHSSSGTTGTPVIIPYTQQDVIDWATQFARCYEMAGITPLDRIQITPGYGLWTAGIGFQLGAERLGAMAIPMGPGNTDKQLQMMQDLKSTVITATSSYALLLAEEISKRGLRDKIHLKKGVIGSERWGEKMRNRIQNELGIEIYDIYGLTEVYGPGIGISCDAHAGMHIWDDFVYIEIVDPETGENLLILVERRLDNVAYRMGFAMTRREPARRRGRRAGAHYAAQAGRPAYPLPHPRPHPYHPRYLPLRQPPSAHRYAHRPHRRHVQGEGLQHVPGPGRGGHQGH
jgi:phenylacetate-CoA ligase